MGYSAESYEDYMVPGLFAPWASLLVETANVRLGERALDVACGTGIVARHVAPSLGLQGTALGLDLSMAMLDVGRAAAERQGLAVCWHAGLAEHLPFQTASVDVVFCQFGLMFFDDRHQALREMHRVLRPGGLVAVSVWQGLDRHPFHRALHEVSSQRLGRSSVWDVFSLGRSDELRQLLTDAGFRNVQIESPSITARLSNPEEFLAWETAIDPGEAPGLQSLDAQTQQVILASVRQDMLAPLKDVTLEGQVVLPTHAHIAHAWS